MSPGRWRNTVLPLLVILAFAGHHAQAAQRVALLIGVEKYVPTELPPLKFAEDDVSQLAQVLKNLGFEVTVMASGAENPALRPTTAQAIEAALKKQLDQLEQDSTLVVVFSGHGLQFKNDPQAKEQRTNYFCPEAARLGEKKSLVDLDEVYRRIHASRAARKLLIVDACRDQIPLAGAKSAAGVELDPVGISPNRIPKGMLALFSCSSAQKSYEDRRLGHGIFCYNILKYLQGDAGPSLYPNNRLSVSGLSTYASTETARYVELELRGVQNPELISHGNDWSLGPAPFFEPQRPQDSRPQLPRPQPPPPPKVGQIVTNSVGMKLKALLPGEVLMGAHESDALALRSERPQRRVRLSQSFLIGLHEVTNAQYRSVLNRGSTGEDNEPVTEVTWFEALEFCNRLSLAEGLQRYYDTTRQPVKLLGGDGYRLPTEAEWEYACRGGTATWWSFGDDASQAAKFGWFTNNSQRQAQDVGTLRPNPLGLYDMHGNVWEWCWDGYGRYQDGRFLDPVIDPVGTQRVLRGGSWFDPVEAARSSARLRMSASSSDGKSGFRIVRSVELDDAESQD